MASLKVIASGFILYAGHLILEATEDVWGLLLAIMAVALMWSIDYLVKELGGGKGSSR